MRSFYILFFSVALSFLLVNPTGSANAQDSDRKIINTQEKTITVYPIPAINFAHIRLSPALKKDVDKIEIINLIGKKITEQTIIDKNVAEITFTNLNDLPQGIYMIITRDKFGKIIQSAKMLIDK